jgi:hypothetical protein
LATISAGERKGLPDPRGILGRMNTKEYKRAMPPVAFPMADSPESREIHQ